jgi:hypothetical protein
LVAVGSVDAVVEPSVAADDFPGVAFAVTGTVAATALVNAAAFTGAALAGAACWIAGAATAAEIAIFAVAVPEAVAFAVVVVAAASVAAVFESVLIWADEAACAEIACVLAAIAAAAIASGAVELPDVVAAGTFVDAVVTGIATATGFGVVERPACWTRMVRSAADVSPLADLSVDFVGSAFEALPDFVCDGWVAPVLVAPLVLALLALMSEGGPALALLFGSLLAA